MVLRRQPTRLTTPLPSTTLFRSAPISVASSLTIKAIATAPGFAASAVGSAAYVIQSAAATPTFSPAAGTYTTAQSVTSSDTTAGATIYYTTDGSTPTTHTTNYTAPLHDALPICTNLSGLQLDHQSDRHRPWLRCQRRRQRCLCHSICRSNSNFQSGSGHLCLRAKRYHQRYDSRRNHLLHDGWF